MKRKPWNKPTKPFPNKWKRKLAKSDKGSYYKQGQWISEYEDGKGQHYNEYCDDDLDLVTTDESSCSGELEAQSHTDSVPHDSLSQPRFLFQHLHLLWCYKPENIFALSRTQPEKKVSLISYISKLHNDKLGESTYQLFSKPKLQMK